MNVEERLLEGNFTVGRGGVRPDVIVVHIMEGSMSGTDAWFRRLPGSKDPVSAHYGVSKAGEVRQWVADEDQAWHAGKRVAPTAAIVKERDLSPNLYSIGIECEGFAKDEPTSMQLASLAELVQEIAARHQIPLTRRHIIGHREIRANKPCPGKIDVDLVVKMALAIAKAPKVDVAAALNTIETHMRAVLAEVEDLKRRLA